MISVRLMQAHAEELVEKYDIGWSVIHAKGCAGYAYKEIWEIETPVIKGRLSYATTLHEIGHLVGPYQDVHRYHTMMHEIGAWKWARRTALIWSPAMQRHADECLDWYRKLNRHGITNAQHEERIKQAHYDAVDRLERLMAA